nr:hypothetical protein [Tanacetum cinerariifolium]
VNKEEVIGDMNCSLDNNVEKLSQDDSEMLSGMKGDLLTWVKDDNDSKSGMEGEYLETFSGMESDLQTWVEDDDDESISGMEGDTDLRGG